MQIYKKCIAGAAVLSLLVGVLRFASPASATAFTVLSLGDWMGQLTYGEMIDGELRLMTYSTPTS